MCFLLENLYGAFDAAFAKLLWPFVIITSSAVVIESYWLWQQQQGLQQLYLQYNYSAADVAVENASV